MAQLGKRRRGTPRQIPGHYAFVRGCTGFLEAWKARNYWALGSYFPNFTNRTPSAQACEARELCFSHPIEGYEIEETVRSAAAVANAKIRFRTSGRSLTALIRLSRIDGTTPAADWEPGAWKLMGYEVAPSLHDWLRAKLWKVIARETIERKIS